MPVEIRTTVSQPRWREQYDRMQRWRRRMATSSTDTDLVDNTHAFFITCFHLRDWLQSDTSVPQSVRVDAPILVKTDASLQICADLANGLKHLVLTQPLKVGAPVSLSSGNPPTVHDAGGASLGDAAVIGDQCIAAWNALLKSRGLL